YDDSGNRTAFTNSLGAGSYTAAYSSTNKHRLTSITVNGMTKTFTYDANGNIVYGPDLANWDQVATRTITYNAENMPTSIAYTTADPTPPPPPGGGHRTNKTGPSQDPTIATTTTVSFVYDGDNERVKRAITGGSTTYYVGPHYEVVDGTQIKKYISF